MAEVSARVRDLGCYEISLGDTIGIGNPGAATEMVRKVKEMIPVEMLAAHFHDTYGQALVNLLAVLQEGVAVVDSAVAGLGGCPFARGATGNVATEDVLYMLEGLGVETGVDLHRVAAAGQFISDKLGRQTNSRVAYSIARKRGDIKASPSYSMPLSFAHGLLAIPLAVWCDAVEQLRECCECCECCCTLRAA